MSRSDLAEKYCGGQIRAPRARSHDLVSSSEQISDDLDFPVHLEDDPLSVRFIAC